MLARGDRPALTPHTATSAKALAAIDEVAESGYTVTGQEHGIPLP